MSLINIVSPVGSVLLINKRKEGMAKALFEDLATALEQSRVSFDVNSWCKDYEKSIQVTKKRATKEG